MPDWVGHDERVGTSGRPDRIVTVKRVIAAAPELIFDVLASPAHHHRIDGSGMLRGEPRGPERLTMGSKFTLAMKQGVAGYRSLNRVVEFDENRAICWETYGEVYGRRFVGGQRWRYELVPIAGADGPAAVSTLVLHSYDWGAAMMAPVLQLLGYPRRMAAAMPKSLRQLDSAVVRVPEVGA